MPGIWIELSFPFDEKNPDKHTTETLLLFPQVKRSVSWSRKWEGLYPAARADRGDGATAAGVGAAPHAWSETWQTQVPKKS